MPNVCESSVPEISRLLLDFLENLCTLAHCWPKLCPTPENSCTLAHCWPKLCPTPGNSCTLAHCWPKLCPTPENHNMKGRFKVLVVVVLRTQVFSGMWCCSIGKVCEGSLLAQWQHHIPEDLNPYINLHHCGNFKLNFRAVCCKIVFETEGLLNKSRLWQSFTIPLMGRWNLLCLLGNFLGTKHPLLIG